MPSELQKRVLDFIAYIDTYGMTQDESEIVATLPRRLQGELAINLHMQTLKKVRLLADCEPSLLYELVMRLTMFVGLVSGRRQPSTRCLRHMYGPGDILCHAGDVAKASEY